MDVQLKHKDVARHYQKELLTNWYGRITRSREEGRPLAYSFIPGNVSELLRSFGFEVTFPEVNALQCAIKKVSGGYILKSEDIGHSSDVCSYMKNDVGIMLSGGKGPEWTIPKPDLLLCNYTGCTVYAKWWEAVSRMYDVPIVFLDIPFAGDGITENGMQYVMGQIKELIKVCENITGRKYDEDRLSEMLEVSRQAEDLWVKILQSGKNVPSPIDAFFEAVSFMAPIYVLRGTEELLDYYQKAWAEVEERINLGIGPVPEERFRVVMEGVPCWSHFTAFWGLLKKWGVVNVAATYTKVGGVWDFGFRHDPDRPLESIAELLYGNRIYMIMGGQRADTLERYAKEYQADGMIIHSVKSCRAFSMGQGAIREEFIRNRGLPTLHIESDIADPRYYQEAQLRNRIDAFFELMEHRKATNGGEAE